MRSLYPNSIATRGRLAPTLESLTLKGYLPEDVGGQDSFGASQPVRQLFQEDAVRILPFWIRQALRQNVRALDRGSSILLLQMVGTMRLVLEREDYTKYVVLLTDEPWIAGYELSEPALTEWIEESIRSVFTQT